MVGPRREELDSIGVTPGTLLREGGREGRSGGQYRRHTCRGVLGGTPIECGFVHVVEDRPARRRGVDKEVF